MEIKKVIKINDWDKDKNNIIKYWEIKGIKFNLIKNDLIGGYRGSIVGNLIAFNMQKLLTNLTIAKLNNSEIEVILKINTMFQYITDSNKEYWDTEIKGFKEFLINDNLMQDEWKLYNKRARIDNIKWVLYIVGIAFLIQIILQFGNK